MIAITLLGDRLKDFISLERNALKARALKPLQHVPILATEDGIA